MPPTWAPDKEKTIYADPEDIQLDATGTGEFAITRLQKKSFTLFIRDKDNLPFLRIEVNGEKGFQIFPLKIENGKEELY